MLIKLMTRESMAREARALYRETYPSHEREGTEHKARRARVEALPENPTPEEVDAAMGNGSWTVVPTCFCCNIHKGAVVMMDATPEEKYDGCVMYLCLECLDLVTTVAKGGPTFRGTTPERFR